MGLWDSIKKGLKFSILGINDPKIADEIKELNLGKITKIDNKISIIINNPIMNVFEEDKNSIEKAEHLLFINQVGWVKKEIVLENFIVANNYKNPGETIRKIRPILNNEDYSALSLAIRIIRLEDKGIKTKKQYKELFKAYGPRGIRLYSLCRSGILEEFSNNIKEKSYNVDKEYLEKLITSPEALFVGGIMKEENVENQIEERLERLESFDIFARSGCRKIAIDSVEMICAKNSNILFKIDPYKIGEDDAVVIHIQKIRKKKKKKK